mmetsp:Transcript_16107/g.38198  ORF Transcript_16107/g.38198 Transcript_16107/m.38198 type:complete len:318 (+) Transcript_16107:2258-3211(+)
MRAGVVTQQETPRAGPGPEAREAQKRLRTGPDAKPNSGTPRLSERPGARRRRCLRSSRRQRRGATRRRREANRRTGSRRLCRRRGWARPASPNRRRTARRRKRVEAMLQGPRMRHRKIRSLGSLSQTAPHKRRSTGAIRRRRKTETLRAIQRGRKRRRTGEASLRRAQMGQRRPPQRIRWKWKMSGGRRRGHKAIRCRRIQQRTPPRLQRWRRMPRPEMRGRLLGPATPGWRGRRRTPLGPLQVQSPPPPLKAITETGRLPRAAKEQALLPAVRRRRPRMTNSRMCPSWRSRAPGTRRSSSGCCGASGRLPLRATRP